MDLIRQAKAKIWPHHSNEPAADFHLGREMRFRDVGILLAGLIAGQLILFGPSLVGKKILAPLDILGQNRVYLTPSQLPKNYNGAFDGILSDLVFVIYPQNDYLASEVRAGRWPLWNPCIFAGVSYATAVKYSPFMAIYFLLPSPYTLAWIQLIQSIIAGVGAYLFFRHVLKAGFWPAVFGAWCYPLTGYFIVWQGYPGSQVVCWLPWLWLGVNLCVRKPCKRGSIILVAATGLCILSGQVDIAGLVLLSSGLFALALMWNHHGKDCWRWNGLRTLLRLACCWTLGLMLGMPYLLPLLEYSHSGSRMERRAAGEEERPPVGWTALPQLVLPNMYGATHQGAIFIAPRTGNVPESASAAYIGLVATLFLAPLAFCDRRRRFLTLIALVLAFLSFCWVLDVPGIVSLMRWPGLNMFSFNRFTFMGAFCLLSMAVIGLEQLSSGQVKRSDWFQIPIILVAVLSVWCLYRTFSLPEPVATQLASSTNPGVNIWGMPAAQALAAIQQFFRKFYGIGLMLCVVSMLGWMVLLWKSAYQTWLVPVVAGIALIDLLMYAYGVTPQCDPALYYPKIPSLVELAKNHPKGRILAIGCLPSNLNMTHGLSDIRGYDAVDPKLFLDVLDLARAKDSPEMPYARSQWFTPRLVVDDAGRMVVPPVLSMLNVRYLIFRGTLPANVQRIIEIDDYIITENTSALPRAYVPQSVQVVPDQREMLSRLGQDGFRPSEVAFVESPIDVAGECHGRATLVKEVPSQVTIDVEMQTRGLLVLADLWDGGWRAYLNGKSVPIIRTNHALRGVVVPVGKTRVVFYYEPKSFYYGMLAAITALFIVVVIVFSGLRRKSRAAISG